MIDGQAASAPYTISNVVDNTHTISATFAIDTFTLTVTAGSNGQITPGTGSVNYGATPTYTITPNLGYHIASITVNGESVAVATPAGQNYQFSAVTADTSIEATFAIDAFTIAASAGVGGSISPSGTVSVDYGASQTFTVTPNLGYHIVEVLIDGQAATAPYTISNVVDNTHTISATFAIDTFTLTVTAGSNGQITPGTGSVNYGATPTYTITPNLGYHIASITVNGESVAVATPAGQNYQFSAVTADTSIEATFAIDAFTIAASAGVGGSISPSGTVSVDYGASQTFTVTPNLGYHIVEVLIDGQAATAPYTISNVVDNTHTISATFAIDTFTLTVTAGSNGQITPGTGSVNYGATPTYTITPNLGYHIASITVNGESVAVATPAGQNYQFSAVTADTSIEATFAIDAFTIAASAGVGGSISPSGTVSVDYGASQTFTVTPNLGYHIVEVLIDGQAATAPYTISNVVDNTHTISATFAIDTFTLTVTAGSNGQITPGTGSVNYGATPTYTITPNLGYHIASITVNGESVAVATPAGQNYQFSAVTADTSIEATFAIDAFTIAASAGVGGSISPSGTVSVDYGASQTFTVTPNLGYHIVEVLIDGQAASAPYTISNVLANTHTISASFAIDTFTITVTQADHGTIAPGSSTVDYGSNNHFTITAATGYHIVDVTVDSISVGAVTSWEINNVQANHAITATYAIDTFTIAASAGLGGSISPSGSVNVDYGESQTFTVTADTGYHLVSVLIDGVAAVAPYTISNVVDNTHTIVASFALDTFAITITQGANGQISGPSIADYGTDASYTFAPVTGYHIVDVLVDGVSKGAVASYTIVSVKETHTVTASFAINPVTATVAMVVRGTDNAVYYRTYDSVSATWNSWVALPGSTNDSPAAVVCGNELHIVVRGMDGVTLWHNYVNLVDGSFSGWTWISGTTPSPPTLTSNGNVVVLVVRGADNSVYYRVYTVQTRTWGDWKVFAGGLTCDKVAATMQGNVLDIVVRGFSETDPSEQNMLWQAEC